MSIDEAHYYFPQEGAREDFNKKVVEAVINKLTRLGRMGVVFATHSPADLNDLSQLTKIAMRSEPKVLKRMTEYAGAYAQSGVAVAKSYLQYTRCNLQNSAVSDETQRSLATPDAL